MSDRPSAKDAARLLYHLRRGYEHSQLARTDTGLSPEMALLRTWQSERLARTYADLLATARYGPACRFFLSDIYAPRDFSDRDHDIEQMYDFMLKFLPARVLHSLTLAIELNTLTHELDQALLEVLVDELGVTDSITEQQYAEACRICDNYDERAKQIDLIVKIGRGIGRLARLPLISISLRLVRGPARQGGWFELQDFLERGLAAFKRMRGTKEFLRIIKQREERILDQIFAGDSDPFAI